MSGPEHENEDEVREAWAVQIQIEADQEARHGLLDPWEDWDVD